MKYLDLNCLDIMHMSHDTVSTIDMNMTNFNVQEGSIIRQLRFARHFPMQFPKLYISLSNIRVLKGVIGFCIQIITLGCFLNLFLKQINIF